MLSSQQVDCAGFIGWLGKKDDNGNEQFVIECERCNGVGTHPSITGKQIHGRRICGACSGYGIKVGPFYCRDCGAMLPHNAGVLCSHTP